MESLGCLFRVVLFLVDLRDPFYRWILRRRYSKRIRRSLSRGHSSVTTAALLHPASAAKIRALEFTHHRFARGRFAQNDSGNRKVAGTNVSGEALAEQLCGLRHRG